ncbi:MAG: hypothetical protein KAH44_19130, partial [Oricola sp.]|nr:hypothetical protein [Oricola sp.]
FDNFRLSNSISPSLTGGSDCGYHRFSNIIKVSGPAVNFTIPSTMPKCEVTRRKSVGFVDNSSTGDVQIRDDLTLTVTDLTGVASATVHAVKTGGTAHLRVIGATGTGASDIITISGLTETYRPRKNTGFFPVRVVDNNVYGFGMCRVTTAGLIEIYKDAAGASFGSSANTGFSTFDIDFATEVI